MVFPASVAVEEVVIVVAASGETFADFAALVFVCGTAGPTFNGPIVFTEEGDETAGEAAEADPDDAADVPDDDVEDDEDEFDDEEDDDDDDELDPPDDAPLLAGVGAADGTGDG